MEELFTKELSQTDVNYRLTFPTDSLREYFPIQAGANSTTFRATDTSEREWQFNLCVRRNDPNGPKPWLSGDWLPFVRAKGLREDDRIVLYRYVGVNGVQYRIKAERRIFGVWANMM